MVLYVIIYIIYGVVCHYIHDIWCYILLDMMFYIVIYMTYVVLYCYIHDICCFILLYTCIRCSCYDVYFFLFFFVNQLIVACVVLFVGCVWIDLYEIAGASAVNKWNFCSLLLFQKLMFAFQWFYFNAASHCHSFVRRQ